MADLSTALGIPREQLQRMWDEVKRNSVKLTNCRTHSFVPTGEVKTLGQKYRCVNCDGTIDSIARSWYEEGRRHALRPVIAHWNEFGPEHGFGELMDKLQQPREN